MQREKPFMFSQLHPSAIRGGKIAVVLSLQGETCLAMFFQEKNFNACDTTPKKCEKRMEWSASSLSLCFTHCMN